MFDLSHKIGGGVVVVVVECVCVWGGGGGISWLISVDYLCQQWFRKLIVGWGGGGFLDWYLSTTYASNDLENWLSLICTNIKLSL